jgi:primosomal protein N' (replication factor Y)
MTRTEAEGFGRNVPFFRSPLYNRDMGFYTVWVRSLSYRGREPLTYSCAKKLATGTIVCVPLQKEFVLGFVEKEVSAPKFATKPVEKVYNLPQLPAQTIKLASWLRDFYATNLGTATNQLLPPDLSDKTIETVLGPETVVNKAQAIQLPPLTVEQQAVVKKISKPDTYLLHGKTGSGKTRVYIELALQAVAASKSAIVLTPEISLTSQLAKSFQGTFGEQVVVLHSQLTPVQRQKIWLKILTTQPLIVIGPRSALFSPVSNLGLIVIDEAHESSYKQEQAPYYHARAVASQLAQLHQASLIIGSATPSVSDYFLAEQRGKQILRMEKLAQQANDEATHFQVVDLRDRSQFSRSGHLSKPLLDAVRTALGKGEQSLVYLNRRGTARVVLCENCGWQALCPHCDLPLVYHADSGRFRCHTCGFNQSIVTSCPTCGHPSVTFRSFGTKAITEEVQKLFPEARVQRFDTDNSKAERFEQHYEAIKAGDVDILVGTQLLAKGLDLPKLSTIGIVLADSSLYLPDFSSQERTYQLLTQALGRVGRGHRKGYAIIQTYQPDSPVLQSAISGEWDEFYKNELAERQKFHFPPYYHLLKLSCKRATYESAESAAQKLKTEILQQIPGIQLDGPAPSFHEKLQGKFQCQLVLRSTHRQKLLAAIKLLPASGWTYDIDPINLL